MDYGSNLALPPRKGRALKYFTENSAWEVVENTLNNMKRQTSKHKL